MGKKGKKKTSMLERYMEKAGGQFVGADSVEDGDKFLIERVELDDETFDNPYINCTVKSAVGDELVVRLGSSNVKRVAEVLSLDESEWPGNYLVVLTTMYYKGLKQTGILWTGEIAEE